MQQRSSSDDERKGKAYVASSSQKKRFMNRRNYENVPSSGLRMKQSSSLPYIQNFNPDQVSYGPSRKYGRAYSSISNNDALRLSTNETQPRGHFRNDTMNSNYKQYVIRGYGPRYNGNQFESSGDELIMLRREKFKNTVNSRSHNNLAVYERLDGNFPEVSAGSPQNQKREVWNTVQQSKMNYGLPPKVTNYADLVNANLPNHNLTKSQLRIINDLHNDVLNQNLMLQEHQLIMNQQEQQYQPVYVEEPERVMGTYMVRKPPLALNPHIKQKQRRLKEMMLEQQNMDLSPPITPAGHFIDRSMASFTDNGGGKSNFGQKLYKSNEVDARYYYNQVPVTYQIAPQKRMMNQTSQRNRAIEMWEYLTSRLIENSNNVLEPIGAGLRKRQASVESLERISPIDNWKKLLIIASKSSQHDFQIRSLSMMVRKLSQQKEHLRSMTAMGKWSILARRLVEKHDMLRGKRINNRWRQLFQKASILGYINLATVGYGVHTLKQMNSKLEIKNEKQRILALMARWRRLIYGITRNERQSQMSMQICIKWASLSRKLIGQSKVNQMQTLGKWNILIKGILSKSKTRSLRNLGRWNTLIKRLLQSQRVITSWQRMVIELGARRQIRLNGVRVIILKLSSYQEKTKTLKVYHKWKRFIDHVLKPQLTSGASLTSDKVSMKTAIKLKKLAMGLLRQKERQEKKRLWMAKQKQMSPLEKWALVIKGVMKKVKAQNKQQEQGKTAWQKLLERTKEKLEQRTPFQKWEDMTKALLEKNRKKQGKPKTAWDELLERMRQKQQRTPLERWESVTRAIMAKNKKKIEKPKTAWDALVERMKQKQQRTPIEKWRDVTEKLLQRNKKKIEKPKSAWELLLERTRQRQQRHPLEKWEALVRALLEKKKRKFEKPKTAWDALVERMRQKQQRTPLEKWEALTKSILDKNKKKIAKPKTAWDALVERMRQKQQRTPLEKWEQVTKALMAKNKKKLEKPKTAWDALVERMREKQQRTPLEKWESVTKALLEKNKNKVGKPQSAWDKLLERMKTNPPKMTPMQNWQTLVRGVLWRNPSKKKSKWDQLLQRTRLKQQRTPLEKWGDLIQGILKKAEKQQWKKLSKWDILVNKIKNNEIQLPKSKQSAAKQRGGAATMSMKMAVKWACLARYMLNKNQKLSRAYVTQKRMSIYCKWTRMAQRMLTLLDDDFMEDRVQRRWKSIIRKMTAAGQINNVKKLFFQNALEQRQKQRGTQARWTQLMQNMMFRRPEFFFIQVHRATKKSRVFKRWQRIMVKFSRVYYLGRLDGIALKLQQQAAVVKRWTQLVKGLDKRYQFVQSAVNLAPEPSSKRFKIKQVKNKPTDAYIELDGTDMDTNRLPDVSRMKVKKIQVKNPERLKKQIEEANYERGRYDGNERDWGRMDSHDQIRRMSNSELQKQVYKLQNQLQNKKEMMNKLENLMDDRMTKFNEEVELGKQRENKLMFFLYVLKEERKCPVTEVFEEYIKPIETNRFQQDYGDDYRKALKKIKKQTKYEKLYNKALRKMRNLNGNKEYKSDSCLPSSNVTSQKQQMSDSNKVVKARGRTQIHKKVINVKNQKLNSVVRIPTLDIGQLGNANRAYNGIKNGPNLLAMQGGGQYGGQFIPGLHNQAFAGNDFDNLNYYSSSSDDSASKAKVKDIVFDPRQRKRLLDSVGVVTTRNKWKNLNSSE